MLTKCILYPYFPNDYTFLYTVHITYISVQLAVYRQTNLCVTQLNVIATVTAFIVTCLLSVRNFGCIQY